MDQTDSTLEKENVTISLTEVELMLSVIDVVAKRGGFLPADFKIVGELFLSATSHDSDVSIVSQGLNTIKFGVDLNMDRCSMGWCVGPSSPSPIESCVNTYITLTPIRADNLMPARI